MPGVIDPFSEQEFHSFKEQIAQHIHKKFQDGWYWQQAFSRAAGQELPAGLASEHEFAASPQTQAELASLLQVLCQLGHDKLGQNLVQRYPQLARIPNGPAPLRGRAPILEAVEYCAPGIFSFLAAHRGVCCSPEQLSAALAQLEAQRGPVYKQIMQRAIDKAEPLRFGEPLTATLQAKPSLFQRRTELAEAADWNKEFAPNGIFIYDYYLELLELECLEPQQMLAYYYALLQLPQQASELNQVSEQGISSAPMPSPLPFGSLPKAPSPLALLLRAGLLVEFHRARASDEHSSEPNPIQVHGKLDELLLAAPLIDLRSQKLADDAAQGRLELNSACYLENIPPETWAYCINGQPVFGLICQQLLVAGLSRAQFLSLLAAALRLCCTTWQILQIKG